MPDQRQITLAMAVPRPNDGAGRVLFRSAGDLLAWVRRCAQRSSERRTLAEFGDWQLRDIGITRAEAGTEAAKWFWQA